MLFPPEVHSGQKAEPNAMPPSGVVTKQYGCASLPELILYATRDHLRYVSEWGRVDDARPRRITRGQARGKRGLESHAHARTQERADREASARDVPARIAAGQEGRHHGRLISATHEGRHAGGLV